MFLEFIRVIQFGVQSFFRNIWLSIVTVTIIVLALFSVSFLLYFNYMTDHLLQVVENRTSIYIDLTRNATEEQARVLVDELAGLDEVKEAVFITPEQTLIAFKERHKDNPLLLESLDSLEENPFRGSIKLSVYDISNFSIILEQLAVDEYKQYLEIEDKEFTSSRELIEGISLYSAKIEKAALFVSIIFILISFMVVFNTIQVGIYTHREEIGIMKLVGASNGFIRSPFMVEGLLYSLLSVIIITVIMYPTLSFLQPYADSFFKEYSTNLVGLFNKHFFQIVGIQFLLALVITIFSSYVAVRRYLKV